MLLIHVCPPSIVYDGVNRSCFLPFLGFVCRELGMTSGGSSTNRSQIKSVSRAWPNLPLECSLARSDDLSSASPRVFLRASREKREIREAVRKQTMLAILLTKSISGSEARNVTSDIQTLDKSRLPSGLSQSLHLSILSRSATHEQSLP
jgi:hypothetical protein